MKAPLDWNKPKGDTIGIALVRAKAGGDKSKRIGSLVFNFGGPGGSGGPRCHAARVRRRLRGPAHPLRPGELRPAREWAAAPASSARATPSSTSTSSRTPPRTPRPSAPISWPTPSSSTRPARRTPRRCSPGAHHRRGPRHGSDAPGPGRQNAALLRHLLRHRTRRCLRPLVPQARGPGGLRRGRRPHPELRTGFPGTGQGLPARARQLRRRLHVQDTDCPIGDTAQDVKDRIAKLLKSLDSKPIPGIFPRQLTQTAATNGIAQALYSKDFWEYLTEGLEQAYSGDGKVLMALSDSMNGRSENGEYSNITAANIAINCADDKPRYTAADVEGSCRSSGPPLPSSATSSPGAWSAAPTGRCRAPPTIPT